ncbi:MAG: hypothetical protein AAF813_02910 [Pseudomonadota bacterium]
MTGFLAQMIGAALLFALIEGIEGLIRWRIPGLRNLTYSALKLSYGLPLVLLAGDALMDRGVAIQWFAVGLGVGVAAVLALWLFGGPRKVTP